mgnify:CR=1 FL=1
MQRVNKLAKIRFKGYDISLEKKTIGDITTSFSGGTPKSSNKSYYEGDIPFIRSGEVKSKQTELFISDEALQNSSAKMVSQGDILYALYGATSGEVAISQINGAINQAILAIKPKSGYSSEFIMNYLKKEKDNILEKYLQGGQGNLSAAIVKSIELSLPSQEEQSAIGFLFRTLDDLLASYKDNLANYQSFKETMLSKMFPKAGQTVPEIRLDGFEGEWEVQTLKELARFSKGNGYIKNDLVNSGKEIILYGQLYTNYQTVISKVNTFVTTVKANAVISKGGEVIVPASGESAEDISRASVVEKSGIILGGDLNIIYPDEKKVDSIFLALTISNGSQQKELIKRAQGKSVVHLRNNDLEKVILHYPSIAEQQAIGAYFSNLDNLINSHQDKISQLETLKKKLLQDMFI